MSAFKKFTDFCCGIAAFSAVFYLFREFMEYKPKENETAKLLEKLKLFLSDEPQLEYRPYLMLIALLAVSLLISLLAHRVPYLALPTSLLALACSVDMLERGEIYEYPMLYVVLGALHVFGILWECIRRDREDLRQRASLALHLGTATVSAVCYVIWHHPKSLVDVPMTEAKFFDRVFMYALSQEASFEIFKRLAIVFAVLFLLGLLLWELHYLNALLAMGTAVYSLLLLSRESYSVYPTVLPTLAVALAIGRIVVMLSCAPSKRRREPQEQREEQTETP